MSVSCLAIRDEFIDDVVACLARSFPRRPRNYWVSALERMSLLPVLEGYPRLGYALLANGRVVGVLLLIFARCYRADQQYIRCNISSWCVDPEFRASAIVLHMAAVKHREVTYFNISPAPHTRSLIEAMGFRRISSGQILFFPLPSGFGTGVRVCLFAPDSAEASLLPAIERRILADHAALGCMAILCVAEGNVFPFVFQRRMLLRNLIAGSQLIYCRNMEEFFRFSRSLGRYLLFRSGWFFIVDASGPRPGLAGRYFPERNPRYFKGPNPPSVGDLAYTELAVLGP